MRLIIATNNRGKVREYRDILEPLGFETLSQEEAGIHLEVEETGSTFEENAALKARAVFELAHCCVIADDSGLEVEALGGEPGIYSARYRGLGTEHERRLAVLEGLKGVENRRARFVCCICYVDQDGSQRLFKGVWNGRISEEERGDNGFGYDPIFIAEDADGNTTASLPIEFKEHHSHRAKAVRMLMEYLRSRPAQAGAPVIRDVRPSDAPRLLEIYAYYVRQTAVTFETEVPSLPEFGVRVRRITARYPWLVLEEDGRILGYAYAGVFKDRAAYDWACETTVYLAPDARRRGLGRRLYEALEARLGEMGILNLYACVAVPAGEDDEYLTRASAEFHARMGWHLAGTFRQCGYKFGRWYDMVWMEKFIGVHGTPQPPVRWEAQ